MLKKFKFAVLVGLFAAGCMTASDSETCKETEKIITVHDTVTVQVVKRDTVRLRDTVTIIKRDTLRLVDTVRVVKVDTLKMLAAATDPLEIVGVWDGLSGTQKVTLAFTQGIAYLEFSGSLGGTAINGYFRTLENGQAKVTHAGFKDVTWLLSLKSGALTVEEIGVKVFAGQTAELKKR